MNFFDTQVGYDFCAYTMPRLADALERLADILETKTEIPVNETDIK